MVKRLTITNPQIEDYCINFSTVPSAICDELAAFTRENISESQMLIGPMEASMLGFLIHSLSVKRVLELGTFTGYSALAMAEQLPPDGEVVTIDIDEVNPSIGRRYWEKSEHGKKIRALCGEALSLISKTEGLFDLIFVDADKENYPVYFTEGLKKLSPQGVMVFDNVLWSGRVCDESDQATSTRSIKRLNEMIKESPHLVKVLLPVRDGMFLVKKIK